MSKELQLEKKKEISWSEAWGLTKTIFKEYFSESSFRHAAALAYYAIFSLVPLLYLAVYFFGRFLGNDTVYQLTNDFFQNQVGMKDSSGIMEVISMYDVEKRQPLMEFIGIVVLLFVSTAFITTLRKSINEFMGIRKVKVAAKHLIFKSIIARLLSIAFIGFFGTIIIVIYFSQTVLISIGKDFIENPTLQFLIQNGLTHVASIFSNFLIFTLLFKYVHDGIVKWKPAMYGAILTALLVYFGQIIIKFYLTHYFMGANGGVIGSILVILAWIFYTGQIIFLGAKFVKIYSKMIGEPIKSSYLKFKKKSNLA
ncbi:MAG: YihY/virulence factor BrkB family protein [Crocinitomicaceae bacterium]